MRTSKLLSFLLIALLMSCEKKEDSPESNVGTCNGAAFCMDYGTSNKSGSATLSEPPGGRYRIYWENNSATGFEQVELDIYGTAKGNYTIDTTGASGTAVFQYFSATSGVNNGVSGTLVVTQFEPNGNGLTGTFTLTTENGTMVTNGNFINIKK